MIFKICSVVQNSGRRWGFLAVTTLQSYSDMCRILSEPKLFSVGSTLLCHFDFF